MIQASTSRCRQYFLKTSQKFFFILLSIGFACICEGNREVWSLLSRSDENDTKLSNSERKISRFGSFFFASASTAESLSNEDDDSLDYVMLVLCLCLFFSLVYQIKISHSKEENTDAEQSSSYKPDGRLNLKSEIGFKDISMTLTNKKKGDRLILQDIKGKASPGKMLAIMGPSGSGKTSLLQAIAGRIKADKKIKLKGRRYLNNEQIDGDVQIPSAFIPQESNFFPHMTVKETLDFRVELKLGKKLGQSARDELVADLLNSLALTKSAQTKVGNVKVRGVSGGERKRLSIACEMIGSPSVIFLDEPTSGLDSFQAEQVIQTLRKLADDGHTVIAVIHQPSQKVFSLFDDLLLLSEGKLMYYGEVKKARTYFENIGYGASKEVGTAEHVLDCVSKATGDKEEELRSTERIEKISTKANNEVSKLILNPEGSVVANKNTFGALKKLRPAASLYRQFKLLMGRSLQAVFRGKGAIIIKTIQQVTLGIVYGGIYHLGKDQSSIMDRFGLLSLIAIGAANMAVAGTIRSFPKEKAIVGEELASKMYNVVPYFVAKAVSEIPLLLLFSGIFSSIIYPLTGLNAEKGRFKNFIGLTSLHTIAAESAGLLVGSMSANSDVALSLLPPILVLSIIFDGKNIASENVPKALQWIQNIGLVRWGFEALCINEFSGLNFDASGPRRGPVVKTGADALARFGLDDSHMKRAIDAQFKIIGVGWLFSMLGLNWTKQKYQKMEIH